jgi:hypothetical protein
VGVACVGGNASGGEGDKETSKRQQKKQQRQKQNKEKRRQLTSKFAKALAASVCLPTPSNFFS